MRKEPFFCGEHISAGYGNGDIIHDISFELEPHTLTGLLGANGCGKTTLIRCLVNQLSHCGKNYLQGECLETKSVRELAQRVSYISQKGSFSISLPVIDMVLMGFNPVLKVLEYPSKYHKQLAREALQTVGLQEYEHRDYLTLSEGQKQLVLLARTMIENTSLLVLDEPDSALDFQNRYLILKHIRQMITTEEKAGLLCLHDPALALDFCDQLLLMKEGKCIHTLHPKQDDVMVMEEAFRDIYEHVSLAECKDKSGRRRLTLLWEDV